MSYYQYISGVRYARDLIAAAEQTTTGRGESRISYDEIQEIYQLAKDGRRITDTEKRTLQYIAEKFNLTEKARAWLSEQMGGSSPNDLQAIVRRVVRREYGLEHIFIQATLDEVRKQEKMGSNRMFESALRGALDAFLTENRGQLSLSVFVARRELLGSTLPNIVDRLKYYLDQGVLFLIPTNEEERASLDFDVPEDLNIDRFWFFGLHIPAFYPAMFIASVNREIPVQKSEGYISQQPSLDSLAKSISHQFLDFHRLEWHFEASEVQRQMALVPAQNFGDALYAALNGGIFNGESSFSFRDFIREEIWQDPEVRLEEYMREYINTGKISLVPLDYHNQNETVAFPLPENFAPWLEGFWYFGLQMPQKTNVRFLINIPRDSHDGYTGWNDGFVPKDSRPLQQQLLQVLEVEFALPDLQLIFPEEEFISQRDELGAQWRYAQGLLRQALNTVLNDYLEPRSVFQKVATKHYDDVNPKLSNTRLEYRAAIRHLIKGYLKNATLELLPRELPDNNPVDGEPIEDFWQFFVLLPDLSRVGFFVIIPRWPDDEQRPYVYHGE